VAFCSGPILGCSIIHNSAGGTGGLGGGLRTCAGVIANCIVWGNSAVTGPQLYQCSTPTFSDIQDWAAGGEGNLSLDPLFVDPDGPDNDPDTWQDNDYHLSPGSPCVNAGDPAFVPEPGETDIDAEPRVQQCRVDMGADETQFFVGPDCNTNGQADACDIAHGTSADSNGDGIPDECQVGDMNCDGAVDFHDINPFVSALAGR